MGRVGAAEMAVFLEIAIAVPARAGAVASEDGQDIGLEARRDRPFGLVVVDVAGLILSSPHEAVGLSRGQAAGAVCRHRASPSTSARAVAPSSWSSSLPGIPSACFCIRHCCPHQPTPRRALAADAGHASGVTMHRPTASRSGNRFRRCGGASQPRHAQRRITPRPVADARIPSANAQRCTTMHNGCSKTGRLAGFPLPRREAAAPLWGLSFAAHQNGRSRPRLTHRALFRIKQGHREGCYCFTGPAA